MRAGGEFSKRLTGRSLRYLLFAAALVLLSQISPVPVLSGVFPVSKEHPVNFIFLVDVSGSMVSRSTMVKAADGTEITLFEALRQALKQMVSEGRLIGPLARVTFITFGTQVKEMSDWPTSLKSDADRQNLTEKVSSPETLSADKHGDTYMGGAVKLALDRARSLSRESDPCTTTFILMLTDGWDEPPSGAQYKVRDVARNLLDQKKRVQAKAGVDTWQVRVIGLQRLPDRKSGTTTAKELAGLLGGQFIDVNSQAGGTVSDRIFSAVQKTVESIKGEIKLGTTGSAAALVDRRKPGLKSGVVDFGTVDGNGSQTVEIPMDLHSCYAEDIAYLRVAEKVPTAVQKAEQARILAQTSQAHQLISSLPAGSITIALNHEHAFELSPKIPGRTYELDPPPSNLVPLKVHAHSNCPAGHFLGFFRIESTAKVPEFIPFILSVPNRIFVEPEKVSVRLKKKGFFWAEGVTGEMTFRFKQSAGDHRALVMDIQATPKGAKMTEPSIGAGDDLKAASLNDGKPISVTFDTERGQTQEVKIPVAIGADQMPGTYKGKIEVKVLGDAESQAPSEVAYEIEVRPSAWEEVDQLAIPLVIVFVVVVGLCTFLWLATLKRRRD